MFDHLYFGAIGGEDIDILLCDLWIDKATKTQTMVGTDLSQSDAGIAGTAFYDEGERGPNDGTRLCTCTRKLLPSIRKLEAILRSG